MAASNDPRDFKQLIRLAVRAFYPFECPPRGYQGEKEEGQSTRVSKMDKVRAHARTRACMHTHIRSHGHARAHA